MDLPPDVQRDADGAEAIRQLADALNQRMLAAAARGLLISVEVRPDPLSYGDSPVAVAPEIEVTIDRA